MFRGKHLLGVSAIALLVAAGASASGATASDSGAVGASPSGLEEIVVTAQRKEERLQSVPIAVDAFTETKLQSERIQSVYDLQYFVPSMTITGNGITIRNQGNGNTSAGYVGSNILYFNDVPFSAIAAGPGLYYDLQDVEVLKGPQGTLFGRNTNGGAILINSKKPTDAFEGYGLFTLGNYNDHEFEGAVNVPIVPERLLLRVSGNYAHRDGYTNVVGTNVDLDDRDYESARISLRMLPTDTVTNDLVYDYLHSRTNGQSFILLGVNPKLTGAKLFPAYITDAALQRALGPDYQLGNSKPASYESVLRFGVTDTASWDITDDLKVKNIAAYRMNAFAGMADQNGTSLPIYTAALYGISSLSNPHNDQFSEELQFQGQALSDRLQWTAGGFLFYSHNANNDPNINYGVVYGGTHIQFANPVEKSQAIYAQGTYDLSDWVDGLKFTGGYRETWDRRSNTLSQFATGGVCSYGKVPNCTLSTGQNFSGPSWTVGAEYQVAPDIMVYAKASHGYKSGGTNAQTTVASLTSFAPEYVTEEEAGVKSDWTLLGAKLRTDADFYHTDYKAIQIPVTAGTAATGVFGQVVLNAGTATIDGFELNQSVVPFTGLELSLAYAYGDAHYDTLTAPGLNFSNTLYPASPHHTATFSVRYDLPVLPPEWGQASISGTYNWRSRALLGTSFDPFGAQSDYGILNLRVDWDNIKGSPADLSFFVTNATDTRAKNYGFTVYNSIGFSSVTYTEPTMFGAQLRYRFGPGA